MTRFLLIALGGSLGALARYGASFWVQERMPIRMPSCIAAEDFARGQRRAGAGHGRESFSSDNTIADHGAKPCRLVARPGAFVHGNTNWEDMT